MGSPAPHQRLAERVCVGRIPAHASTAAWIPNLPAGWPYPSARAVAKSIVLPDVKHCQLRPFSPSFSRIPSAPSSIRLRPEAAPPAGDQNPLSDTDLYPAILSQTLYARLPKPFSTWSIIAWRSMARLMARRTRTSLVKSFPRFTPFSSVLPRPAQHAG